MIPWSEVSGRRDSIFVTGLGASSTSLRAFIPPVKGDKWRVVAASARFGTAGGSGAQIQVEVAGAGVARGSGVNQLDNALVLTQNADTTVNSPASTPTVFDYTSEVSVILSGTLTGLADCDVVIELEKVG